MFRETSGAALEKALDGVARRLEAVADNLANAETPGHRPRRVEFEQALRVAIEQEHGRQSREPAVAAIERVTPRVARQPILGASSVTVDPETELSALAQNSLQYEAVARALTKQFRMIRSAITGGSQS